MSGSPTCLRARRAMTPSCAARFTARGRRWTSATPATRSRRSSARSTCRPPARSPPTRGSRWPPQTPDADARPPGRLSRTRAGDLLESLRRPAALARLARARRRRGQRLGRRLPARTAGLAGVADAAPHVRHAPAPGPPRPAGAPPHAGARELAGRRHGSLAVAADGRVALGRHGARALLSHRRARCRAPPGATAPSVTRWASPRCAGSGAGARADPRAPRFDGALRKRPGDRGRRHPGAQRERQRRLVRVGLSAAGPRLRSTARPRRRDPAARRRAGMFSLDDLRLASPGAAASTAAASAGGAAAGASGTVVDSGRPGRGSYSGIRVAVAAPSWLVLGEGFNRAGGPGVTGGTWGLRRWWTAMPTAGAWDRRVATSASPSPPTPPPRPGT